jgi:hypothetical protein
MVFQFDKLCENVDNLKDWRHESVSDPIKGKINMALFYLSLNCSFFCRPSGSAPTRCPDAGSGGRERQHRASMHYRRQPSSKNRMEANGTQRHRESGGDAAVPASGTPRHRHVHMWGPERGGSQRTHFRTNRRQVWVLHSESKLPTLLREIEPYKSIISCRPKFRKILLLIIFYSGFNSFRLWIQYNLCINKVPQLSDSLLTQLCKGFDSELHDLDRNRIGFIFFWKSIAIGFSVA